MITMPTILAPEPSGLTLATTSLWDRFWFRTNGSDYAFVVNDLFNFIFWISMAFFAVLMVLMVWFMIRYKRQNGVPAEVSASHNTALEITWSVVPTIGFAVMFFWGTWAYLPKTVVPAGAEEITVSAKQWSWNFTYANGASSLQTEIISDSDQPLFAIPAGRPVKFLLSSSDVIHSFYIPEFRVKRDVFPNRYTVVWAEPLEATHYFDADDGIARPIDKNNNGAVDLDEQGYYLYCTEYCGDQHSQMTSRIAVMDDADYRAWLAQQANTDSIPLVDLGATLFKTKGCNACHMAEGAGNKSAPAWDGIWNQPRPGYSPLNADENPGALADFQYVRHSILEPNAYYAPGFPLGGMNSYQGQLSEREILAIATYIKSLGGAQFAEEAQAESQAELDARAAEAEAASEAETPAP